jgi:mRNA-decapping enzyme subunit 2
MNVITTTPIQNAHKPLEIPSDILDDLAARFLINLPSDEKNNMVRLLFIIEQAHWFYLDFYCTQSDKLSPCGIKQFAFKILNHIPSFKKNVTELDQIIEEWKNYKMAVPTFGAM